MNNINFKSFSELLDCKDNIKLSSELLFPQYLSSIYTNLIQREDNHNQNIFIDVLMWNDVHEEYLIEAEKQGNYQSK